MDRRKPRRISPHLASLVSCPINNLLDPPADFGAGQGAPTSHSGYYGEEAQRRPARKDAAQRASYLWDRTLGPEERGEMLHFRSGILSGLVTLTVLSNRG